MTKKPIRQDTVSPSDPSKHPGRRLASRVRELAAEMDRLDHEAADQLGVGRTDLRGLELLERRGAPMTVGQMADELGLTTGAATLLVDRLERAAYVERRRDTDDRRKIFVDVTSNLKQRTARLFSGVGRGTADLTNGYSSQQLRVIEEFVGRLTSVIATEAKVLGQVSDLSGVRGGLDGDGGTGGVSAPRQGTLPRR